MQWLLVNEPSRTSEPVFPWEAAVPALDPAGDSCAHVTHLPPTTPSSSHMPDKNSLLKSYH